jgi:hypothetical protein
MCAEIIYGRVKGRPQICRRDPHLINGSLELNGSAQMPDGLLPILMAIEILFKNRYLAGYVYPDLMIITEITVSVFVKTDRKPICQFDLPEWLHKFPILLYNRLKIIMIF